MAEPVYAAALDQGTTGTRCLIFTRGGQVRGSAYQEHQQHYPQPGWVEHDPQEIWAKSQQVIRAACEAGGVRWDEIAGIGITNQRETTIVWNRRTGAPVYNAIVWQDTRTREICQRIINDGFESYVKRHTGLVSATYFSGPKLKWMLDTIPGVRAHAQRGEVLFGTVDTWVIWWLTGGPQGGVHITDVTNASRTQLMNLETLDWDKGMLDAFGIPAAMLPKIRSSSEKYGLAKEAAIKDVAISGILGDQQAALVGQTCFEAGEAKNTYGTGCFLLMNTGTKKVDSKSGLLTTMGYKFGDQPAHYALEGSIAITGALVQWVRDNLGMIQKSSDIEKLARTVNDNGGVYFVPAFSGLYAP
ncbi:MAG TPA: glycerol kinase GlpK, partial [bacterium]|nr:glycerol kinase GlpK [bacterium]